jgi:hypothetical protein
MVDRKKSFSLHVASDSPALYSDAEAVFRDLRNRDPAIQHLWSHQADIIRAYHQHSDTPDIALELPTGTGKTLVGLLIGEWRRRSKHERVVYLCPTRQLAHQVGKHATQYGLDARVLVGPQDEYPPEDYAAFASAKSIAITTYAGLFNTNPRLDNAQTLILDDAHAGEGYITALWSLSISRHRHRDLYDVVVQLLKDQLSGDLLPDLLDDDASPRQKSNVDLLPAPRALGILDALTSMIDEYATWENRLQFPWSLIRGRLTACCMLFSWSEILIRPPIPPSLTHPPFATPNQRIYMSATLGASGELERVTGVPSIERIPAPPGWEKQGTGRRLFLFPDASFTDDQYNPWLVNHICARDRTLVLTPHRFSAETFRELVSSTDLTHEILEATDVEFSLDKFTTNPQAILLLTNRYDGLDLPGDTCRSLLVYGLPASVNLYERFLWSKLGLSGLLADRIRTRITQAVGRCTRNPTDYAIVTMVGRDLFEYCIARENRADLHPELRAEMEFGFDNSQTEEIERLDYLVEIFLMRDPEWEPAETDIAARRDQPPRTAPAYVETLRRVVRMEVEYQYDLWRQDYMAALEKAVSIVDLLGGDDLAGYRALWNYFAGCAAYLQAYITGREDLRVTAADRFRRASYASKAVLWFARLSHELGLEQGEASSAIDLAQAVEGVNRFLSDLGMVGAGFDRAMLDLARFVQETDAAAFDRALTELGQMLGFGAHKPSEAATPDAVWNLGTAYVILFEAKSDESPEGSISVSTCRQAQGHKDWQTNRPFFTQAALIKTVIVSPRTSLSPDAVPHAKDLYHVSTDDIRDLFASAEACLRRIRSACAGLKPEQVSNIIMENLVLAALTPDQVLARLTKDLLLTLPQRAS